MSNIKSSEVAATLNVHGAIVGEVQQVLKVGEGPIRALRQSQGGTRLHGNRRRIHQRTCIHKKIVTDDELRGFHRETVDGHGLLRTQAIIHKQNMKPHGVRLPESVGHVDIPRAAPGGDLAGQTIHGSRGQIADNQRGITGLQIKINERSVELGDKIAAQIAGFDRDEILGLDAREG